MRDGPSEYEGDQFECDADGEPVGVEQDAAGFEGHVSAGWGR